MFKNTVLTLFKFLLLFFLIFSIIFITLFLIKLIPIFLIQFEKKKLISTLWSIIQPCFFHSFFNSLIFSLFIFDIVIYNNVTKYKIIAFLIPIVISTIFVFLILFFLKPTIKKFEFKKIDDARLYFPKKSFFKIDEKVFYFNSVEKKKAIDVILYEEKQIKFIKEINFTFYEDEIILNYKENNEENKIALDKNELREYSNDFKLNKSRIFKYFELTSYNFLYSKNIYINLFLWFSVSFFILSFTILVKFKKYPFLTLIYNIIFFILFYYGFNFLFDIYNNLFLNFLSKSLLRDIFLSLFIFTSASILLSFKIVLYKLQKGEDYL